MVEHSHKVLTSEEKDTTTVEEGSLCFNCVN